MTSGPNADSVLIMAVQRRAKKGLDGCKQAGAGNGSGESVSACCGLQTRVQQIELPT